MNRKLRVDFSNDNPEESDNTNANPSHQAQNFQPPPVLGMPPQNGFTGPPSGQTSTLPPLPLGIDLPDGLTCPDAISRTLQTLPTPQLLEVLSQMKTLATNNPSKATELLNQAPQLSYAIFQALLLMDLVSNDTLSSVLAEATNVPPAPTPVQQPQYPAPPAGQFAPGYPPPPLQQLGTPPVRSTPGAYPPPPVPTPQVQPQPVQQQQPAANETEALMQQVLNMPQELVDSLPPTERAQIMAIRTQYGR